MGQKANPMGQKANPLGQKAKLQGQRAGSWGLKARWPLVDSGNSSIDVPRQDSVSSSSSSLDISCLVDNTPFKINEVRCSLFTYALTCCPSL